MELSDHRKHECGEVPIAHPNCVRMCSALEDDFLVLRERAINIYWDLIEVAERRHGAQFAIGKQAYNFLFGREPYRMCGKNSPQAMEIYLPICREHGHDEPHLDFYNDD